MSATTPELEQLAINTLRFLAVDAVESAKSGHPGAPLGCAPIAYLLYHKLMKYNPTDPLWSDRDRFILSNGHASALLYGVLHLTGYDLPIEQLAKFRQWGSHTPGHPEYGETPGVEVTTGPLGQGFAEAVGLAIAEKHLAAVYNHENHTPVDHYTYVLCGDGDLMEGISHESSSLAGTLGLGKLIVLYDDNLISLDGPTDLSFTENVTERFEAYHWHVQMVHDGNDLEGIEKAILTPPRPRPPNPPSSASAPSSATAAPRPAPTRSTAKPSASKPPKPPRRTSAFPRTRTSTSQKKPGSTGSKPS